MALTSREKFSLLLPREFLTRGKFRLFFLLSSSFLKKENRWKLRCLLTSFFPFDSYRRHPNQSARSALHRLLRRSDAESAALLSLLSLSGYRRTHAHLHIVEKI